MFAIMNDQKNSKSITVIIIMTKHIIRYFLMILCRSNCIISAICFLLFLFSSFSGHNHSLVYFATSIHLQVVSIMSASSWHPKKLSISEKESEILDSNIDTKNFTNISFSNCDCTSIDLEAKFPKLKKLKLTSCQLTFIFLENK